MGQENRVLELEFSASPSESWELGKPTATPSAGREDRRRCGHADRDTG